MYLQVPAGANRARYKRGGDVSLVHERLDVRIDGATSFERRANGGESPTGAPSFLPPLPPPPAPPWTLPGPLMIVVPWSSSSEPLLYSAVAPARCTIRTKATTATVSPARAYRQREAACLVCARRPPKSSITLNFLRRAILFAAFGFRALSLAFIRHFPKDQSAIELELEVLTECYAQICVLRALDGEIFFASGGAARRGAREGLLSMSARSAAPF